MMHWPLTKVLDKGQLEDLTYSNCFYENEKMLMLSMSCYVRINVWTLNRFYLRPNLVTINTYNANPSKLQNYACDFLLDLIFSNKCFKSESMSVVFVYVCVFVLTRVEEYWDQNGLSSGQKSVIAFLIVSYACSRPFKILYISFILLPVMTRFIFKDCISLW